MFLVQNIIIPRHEFLQAKVVPLHHLLSIFRQMKRRASQTWDDTEQSVSLTITPPTSDLGPSAAAHCKFSFSCFPPFTVRVRCTVQNRFHSFCCQLGKIGVFARHIDALRVFKRFYILTSGDQSRQMAQMWIFHLESSTLFVPSSRRKNAD